MTTATRPAAAGLRSVSPKSPQKTARPRVQDPTALAVAAATAYLEIRAGRRPAHQMEPLLAPVVRSELERLIRCRRRDRSPTGGISVLRVVGTRPGPGVLDAAVVCRDGGTYTAVATRVEFRQGRWVITALSTPEDQAILRRRGTS